MNNKKFIEEISLNGEEWRDVVGFEGLYMVSSLGRIIALEKYANNRFADVYKPPRILTPTVQKNGSLKIMFSRDGKKSSKRVLSLVAEAFLPKPSPESFIRRKNNNLLDNRLENIEWAQPKSKPAPLEVPSLDGETWKDIVGYEGIYQISNLGRVKSLSRVLHYPGKSIQTQGKILLPFTASHHYLYVTLVKDKKKTKKGIHRLVGEAFIPNPESLPEIDHINGNPKDNNVSNLRWCSHKSNQNNPITRKRASEALLGKTNTHSSKPVVQLKEQTLVKTYPSIAEAGRCGFCQSEVVRSCRKGMLHKGFRWMYLEDYNTLINKSKNSSIR